MTLDELILELQRLRETVDGKTPVKIVTARSSIGQITVARVVYQNHPLFNENICHARIVLFPE